MDEPQRSGLRRGAGFERPGLEGAETDREKLPTEAMLALRAGRKIEAIKIVREQRNMGLAEAKALVERVEREQGPEMPRRASKEDSGVLRLVAIVVILGALAGAVLFL